MMLQNFLERLRLRLDLGSNENVATFASVTAGRSLFTRLHDETRVGWPPRRTPFGKQGG